MNNAEKTITSKQRAYLRRLANAIEPVLHIGKDGVTDNVAKQAWDALEARELIKATVQNGSPFSNTREACESLCEKVHAVAVQCIGKRFTIYRASRNPVIKLDD